MLIAFVIKPFWFPWTEVKSLSTQINGCEKIMSCCFTIMLGYGITFAILTWATHKSSISIVALYASARPLFTVVLSFIINKKELWVTGVDVSLLILVLFGLITSSHSKRKEKQAKLKYKRKEIKEKMEDDFNRVPSGSMEYFDEAQSYLKLN